MNDFDHQQHADTAVGTTEPLPAHDHAPLAGLARDLLEDLDPITDRTTARILATVSDYEAGDEVPREDLWWSVHRNVEVVLAGLIRNRPPSPEDLDIRRALGRRRARQGLALPDLLRAFRVGYLEVWQILVERARERSPSLVPTLAEHAGLVWTTMDEVSAAVESGYREQSAATDQDLRRRGLALVSSLRAHHLPEAAELLHALGHDPAARFEVQAAVSPSEAPTRVDAVALTTMIDLPAHTIVLSQREPDGRGQPPIVAAAHVGRRSAAVGLAELPHALADAESALRAAQALQRREVVADEDWLACLVLDSADRLPRHVHELARSLRDDEDRAATVAAILDAGGNLTAAAASLHLHPNGVAYRLRRLAERDGVDLRTTDGVVTSACALVLARARRHGLAG